MIPQHLLESSFVPTSPHPNDPGELGRVKAFYSERNQAAQQATMWYDRMQQEKEQLEASSELAWAKFNWEKEWEPKKFYADLDLREKSLNFQMDTQERAFGMQEEQNQLANSMFGQFMGRQGGGTQNWWEQGYRDDSPMSVYGEGYFDEGGEGYQGSDSYDEDYAWWKNTSHYKNYDEDYADYGLSAGGGNWWEGQESYDISSGFDDY